MFHELLLSFSFGLALAWFAIPAVASVLAGGIAVVSPVGTSGHYIGGEKECGGVKGGGDVVIKGLICREHNLLSFVRKKRARVALAWILRASLVLCSPGLPRCSRLALGAFLRGNACLQGK